MTSEPPPQESPAGRRSALEAARNASSGFRRRLGVFLSSDAVLALRAEWRTWALTGAGFVGGALLFLSEFLAIRYVTTITASCQELAQESLRDSCLVIGHESHAWGFALLGLLVVVMTFGAWIGGSRPAAVALLVAAVVGLAITLLHDLPQTGHKGGVGQNYAEAKAHAGTGFWFALIGSSLALASGAVATWRTPERRELGRRRAPAAGSDEAAADAGSDEAPADAPPDAEEPASA